jgi:hypothetical protein
MNMAAMARITAERRTISFHRVWYIFDFSGKHESANYRISSVSAGTAGCADVSGSRWRCGKDTPSGGNDCVDTADAVFEFYPNRAGPD